jgi:hypothetical protein
VARLPTGETGLFTITDPPWKQIRIGTPRKYGNLEVLLKELLAKRRVLSRGPDLDNFEQSLGGAGKVVHPEQRLAPPVKVPATAPDLLFHFATGAGVARKSPDTATTQVKRPTPPTRPACRSGSPLQPNMPAMTGSERAASGSLLQ